MKPCGTNGKVPRDSNTGGFTWNKRESKLEYLCAAPPLDTNRPCESLDMHLSTNQLLIALVSLTHRTEHEA